jgi:hypothetical protein
MLCKNRAILNMEFEAVKRNLRRKRRPLVVKYCYFLICDKI